MAGPRRRRAMGRRRPKHSRRRRGGAVIAEAIEAARRNLRHVTPRVAVVPVGRVVPKSMFARVHDFVRKHRVGSRVASFFGKHELAGHLHKAGYGRRRRSKSGRRRKGRGRLVC